MLIKQKWNEIIFDREKEKNPNDINILKLLGLSGLVKIKGMKIFFTGCKRKSNDVSGIVCTVHGIALGIIQ